MENERFEEQETAILQLKWDNEKMKAKMCPVFEECCKGDNCMSYYPGNIVEGLRDNGEHPEGRKYTKIFTKYPPFCQNAIVTGTIEYLAGTTSGRSTDKIYYQRRSFIIMGFA